MLVTESRPRNLSWVHAGPLLFGDWGTSRLYVLGLAFFYTAHASAMYLAAMAVIMAAVAWCYTIICRSFPEGGGVYSSARQLNHTLAVIGATLLLCDYIVTVSLSTIEAFHYFGTPNHLVLGLSIVAIVLLGIVNWYGARNAGRLALIIAVAAMGASVLIAVVCLPFLKTGLKTISMGDPSISAPWDRWRSLVAIMLALSGVEAVSNMTGLMKPPVVQTAKRTIWPVLAEVVIFNTIFGIALAGLPALERTVRPDYVTHVVEQAPLVGGEQAAAEQVPEQVKEYRDTAMRVLAIESGSHLMGERAGQVFGKVTAFIFGLLLLSASNTAIMAMVSVLYSMARDKELPQGLSKLNYSGVPWVGLIAAVLAPCIVLIVEKDVMHLSNLYAVGVCGAITINILCCVFNRSLEMARWERAGMLAVGLVMLAVELTIIATKLHAAVFAGGLVGTALVIRLVLRVRKAALPETMPEPAMGWLAHLKAGPLKLEPGKPRIMLAARGRDQTEYAAGLAKRRGAILFGIYVRTLRLIDVQPNQVPRIEDDKEAQESLGTAALIAEKQGVPFVPIYVTSADIAAEILDYTVTFGCDTLIMGKSRRSLFSRRVAGDVLATVMAHLPDDVSLVTRSSSVAHGAQPG